MKVIGITGGVGSGKSTVMEAFRRRYDAVLIRADDVAKRLMQKNEAAYNKVVDVFGEDILQADGEIDRKKLGDIVFHNERKRMVLNSIVHPAVKKYIMEEVTRLQLLEAAEYCLLEAALLIEDHYEMICDELWYIYAREDIRRKRLRDSRGYTDEKIDGMIASQLSEQQYRNSCKYTIDNSEEMENTLAQIEKILYS